MAKEQDNDAQPIYGSTVAGAAGSTSSSTAEIESPGLVSSVQLPPSPPLWNTREGRIAGYRRMIEHEHEPEQRANLEALIKYYEDGGKVPEGKEEVWAFDGQASFGIRFYTRCDQMPDGWLYKHKWCDSSKWCQINSVPKPDDYMISDAQGRVLL
ncbi:hypothetical protein VSDG_01237 [Cytospora chrysosperma]|uniref:Uncharacterized protein n=1 Tax=Cytospora chrysosperma TaxID=252740 RepID=A0A423WJK9_CYTCH|nr:hypothetical protein VSDG_01237 [Valsa sordida]